MTRKDWISLSVPVITALIVVGSILYAQGKSDQDIAHIKELEIKTELHVERIDGKLDALTEEFRGFQGRMEGFLEAQRIYRTAMPTGPTEPYDVGILR